MKDMIYMRSKLSAFLRYQQYFLKKGKNLAMSEEEFEAGMVADDQADEQK